PCVFGGGPDGEAADVRWTPGPADGMKTLDVGPRRCRIGQMGDVVLHHLGLDPAGADCVAADAVLAEVDGNGAGQGVHGALGRATRCRVRIGEKAIIGADVDDGTFAPPTKRLCSGTAV